MKAQTEQVQTEQCISKKNGWLFNLDPVVFGKVCEFMRAMRGRADALHEQFRKLQPRHGEVGGAAHMDPFVRAEAISHFLSRLNKGDTPEKALLAAKDEAVLYWDNWNKKCQKDVLMQRWNQTDHAYLDDVGRILMRVLESVNCPGCS